MINQNRLCQPLVLAQQERVRTCSRIRDTQQLQERGNVRLVRSFIEERLAEVEYHIGSIVTNLLHDGEGVVVYGQRVYVMAEIPKRTNHISFGWFICLFAQRLHGEGFVRT